MQDVKRVLPKEETSCGVPEQSGSSVPDSMSTSQDSTTEVLRQLRQLRVVGEEGNDER